jgi:chloramphenicol-sensitive protein RarD
VTSASRSSALQGVLLGVGAYVLWGLMPLYLRLLNGVPAL